MRNFYDEELEYGDTFEDLDEWDQMYAMRVLNGLEEPLSEKSGKEYRRIRMDCPECRNGVIQCPRCRGINSWECPRCDRGKIACERCFGVGSIVISIEE